MPSGIYARIKKSKIKIVCYNCNKEVQVIPSRQNTAKFCSHRCSSIFNNKINGNRPPVWNKKYFTVEEKKNAHNEWNKKWRSKNQEKVKFCRDRWIKENPDKMRIKSKKTRAMRRMKGTLSIKTIQLVYEDNIKRFGTLTCYLCLEPILFGKDELEHKIPLSRGGTNEYNNLEIACFDCNRKKCNKTEKEYRDFLSDKVSRESEQYRGSFFIEVCNG